MRKFKYKFEKLERVREIEADQASMEHMRSVNARLQSEENLASHLSELEIAYAERRAISGSTIDPLDLLNRENHSVLIRQHIRLAETDLETSLAREDDTRTFLLEKVKRKKVVVAFRERKYEEYLVEQNRIEQKDLDDTALRKIGLRPEG